MVKVTSCSEVTNHKESPTLEEAKAEFKVELIEVKALKLGFTQFDWSNQAKLVPIREPEAIIKLALVMSHSNLYHSRLFNSNFKKATMKLTVVKSGL